MSLEPYPTYMQGRERTARTPKSQLNTYAEFGHQHCWWVWNPAKWTHLKGGEINSKYSWVDNTPQYNSIRHFSTYGALGAQFNVEFGPQIYTPEERGTQINKPADKGWTQFKTPAVSKLIAYI